jgi:hypothetical protein
MNFLGQFLLSKGLVSEERLNDALEYQRTRNRPIGALAVGKGYLTEEQVEEILEQQRRFDKFFGQIAREKGWLTEEQLDELLVRQRESKVLLGEALLQLGYLKDEEFVPALNEFAKLQTALENASRDLVYSAEDSEYLMVVLEGVQHSFERFAGFHVKLHCICEGPEDVAAEHLSAHEIRLLDDLALEFVLAMSDGMAGAVLENNRLCSERAGRGVDMFCSLDEVVRRYVCERLGDRGFGVHETRAVGSPREDEDRLWLLLTCQYGDFALGFRVYDARESAESFEEWEGFEEE